MGMTPHNQTIQNSLQAYCLRTLLKSILKECMFQWDAYSTWKGYHKNGLCTVYDPHFTSLVAPSGISRPVALFSLRLQGKCKEA